MKINMKEFCKKLNNYQKLGNLLGSSDLLTLSQRANAFKGVTVVVTDSTSQALFLKNNLSFFTNLDVNYFPSLQTLPYDRISPQVDIISQRAQSLYKLALQKTQIFITPISALLQQVAPPEFLFNNVFDLRKGETISLDNLSLHLEKAGYFHCDLVVSQGEYARRGDILDIFPLGFEKPLRIEFFDDEIESIKLFDFKTQRVLEEINELNIFPAKAFNSDRETIELFRKQFRNIFEKTSRLRDHIYHKVSNNIMVGGIEYYQPLFFKKMASIFDYVPENTQFIMFDSIFEKGQEYLAYVESLYETEKYDPLRPLLPVDHIWLSMDQVNEKFTNYPLLVLSEKTLEKNNFQKNVNIVPLGDITVDKNNLKNITTFINNFSGQIIFNVPSLGRAEMLQELFAPLKLEFDFENNFLQIFEKKQPLTIAINSLKQGFIVEGQESIAFICEQDLFQQNYKEVKRNYNRHKVDSNTVVKSLTELKIGQYVVHFEHGIGKYLGLETVDTGDMIDEYLLIEYADSAKLYIPVTNMHLISRYLGDDQKVSLHKLGSSKWEKIRQKVAEKVRDTAAHLLDIYAKRELKKGFKFHQNQELYKDFCTSFPYTETEDQARTINDVLADMCQDKAMDRLVCGDVGFGKTEVAIRAAFLAAINDKQTAILVPTTLLAQQHFENFKTRFANWGINVESISRFKTAKEQRLILDDLKAGNIDIIIGTQRLLEKDIDFKNLGLLIIDEEHRFGVRQKEQIKALRGDLDILTLTATPIPRTLNMAFNGIRDLSIISTPPQKRLSIKTFVRKKEDYLIREAILREILRGGQVYYLYNDVAKIDKVVKHLEELLPQAKVCVAHGQMPRKELAQIMNDFYHQKYNVLVCSTIVETGIDVATANTIIIDGAENLGLAQLHQLRGRVGRSHLQAYAYLLTKSPKLLNKDAKKRLEAMEQSDALGSGILLATEDLEIRGAGELLGEEQSGTIHNVGFTLYMEMLNKAVEALKRGKDISLNDITSQQIEVNLQVPALIGEDYISDITTRLNFYKEIASAESKDDLDEIRFEMIDRFGKMAENTKNLFTVTEIRLMAEQLGIMGIKGSSSLLEIEFADNIKLNPDPMIELIQKNPKDYQFVGLKKFKCSDKTVLENREKRLLFVKNLLKRLEKKDI